jgi:hypothetical protein
MPGLGGLKISSEKNSKKEWLSRRVHRGPHSYISLNWRDGPA